MASEIFITSGKDHVLMLEFRHQIHGDNSATCPDARNVAAGYPMHAVVRGIDQAAIFFAEADNRAFLAALAERAASESVRIHAYVLMTNHVHLLLRPATERRPAVLMKGIGQRYVQCVNRTYRQMRNLRVRQAGSH